MEGLLGQAISLSLIFAFFPLLSALPRGVTLTTQPHIHEHKNFSPNVRMIFHAYNLMDNEWQDEFMKDAGASEASTSHPSTYSGDGDRTKFSDHFRRSISIATSEPDGGRVVAGKG